MSAFSSTLFDAFEDDNPAPEKPNKRTRESPTPTEDVQVKKVKVEEEEKPTIKIENETKPASSVGKKSTKGSEAEDLTSILSGIPEIETTSLQPLLPGCTHEVAYRKDEPVPKLGPRADPPAKEYKFILDAFQQEALCCLDNNQSVLVSAHTSAGKTAVAEYAIAMSLKANQRVIYTTPIKALSNQKYRDLNDEFLDVGLMTGDVTINPTASCLVMTTEILRSMLYKGSEIMREVGWVVFDEIHYMRNKERGVVWEETIILLDDNVHFVFLSATIPNARQFASWICYLHKQPCHVVYTDYRPVPLEHYIFPNGGDGLHLVVDNQGEFREDNFNSAMSVLRDAGDNAKSDFNRRGRKGGQQGKSACYQIVEMIKQRSYLPAIVFSFSKKECEFYAKTVSRIVFNTKEEEKLVSDVFNNAMESLSEEDRALPQVEKTLSFLVRGIGIHHGGLLPIIKETTEILFSEGLIKVLFATETFSMGVNMPAHTVVFTSIRKFDGKDFRWVTGGEYIQMSGRAGRRGMDDRGIVIMMVDEKLSPSVGKALVKGSPDPIDSAFRLTYNMVLNLLRVEEINPEYMLEKSFYQFQHYTAIPGMIKKLKDLEKKHNEVVIPDETSALAYYRIRQVLNKLALQMEELVNKPKYCKHFLQPGRLVKVRNGTDDFGWGVVVNFQEKAPQKQGRGMHRKEEADAEPEVVVDVLLNCDCETIRPYISNNCSPRPAAMSKSGRTEMAVVPIMLPLIRGISSVRLFIKNDLKSLDNRKAVWMSLEETKKRFSDNIPLLDPVEDLRVKDPRLKSIVDKIEAFEKRMYKHPLHMSYNVKEVYNLCVKKEKLAAEVKESKRALKKAKTILQFDELKSRKRVLRRMGYATQADVIEVKGRVACEISAADELLLTELIFSGVFNNITAPQACALLSCFVFDEKSKSVPKLSEELAAPLRQLKETARKIAKISVESKLELDEDEYVDGFKTMLMDVVYAWSQGKNFAQVMDLCETYEGSIIRCMRRLEELLREMANAAKVIGNTQLENKFSQGIELIKRDIVFAASLYL